MLTLSDNVSCFITISSLMLSLLLSYHNATFLVVSMNSQSFYLCGSFMGFVVWIVLSFTNSTLSWISCICKSRPFSICNPLVVSYSGHSLLRDPRHNKGLAFTDKERDAHYLTGLLPPVVLSQEHQVTNCTNYPSTSYPIALLLIISLYWLAGEALDAHSTSIQSPVA